jgi:hypothetical protein
MHGDIIARNSWEMCKHQMAGVGIAREEGIT